MQLSRREFMSVLAAAAAAGFPLGREARAAEADALYEVPRHGNVHLLHMTDCHAQLLPVYFREPSVNLGVGAAKDALPHVVGERLLKEQPGVRSDLDRVQVLWADALQTSGGPFLFGAFGIADAFFAPVAMRFRTYGVPLDAVCADYVGRIEQANVLGPQIAMSFANAAFLDAASK